ncbi:MAG TPA: rhomboid family intramembrane serine protease [Polyangia bacterium]|nr:rhomboid family intramembrane serine protease [Polyangia bacterium]
MTALLIAANALVFVYSHLLLTPHGEELFSRMAGAIPFEIVTGLDIGPPDLVRPPFTILTSMFVHAGWMHLIGNMWFLWLFGDNVEEALGPLRYLLFYLVAGTIGALAQILAMPDSRVPMIGASGAIAGALGGYAMLYPRARVQTLVMIPLLWPVVQVRAWVFLGLWFLGQFLLPGSSGIAWMAHVGGFIAGAGLARLLARRRPPPSGPVQVEYIPPPRRW